MGADARTMPGKVPANQMSGRQSRFLAFECEEDEDYDTMPSLEQNDPSFVFVSSREKTAWGNIDAETVTQDILRQVRCTRLLLQSRCTGSLLLKLLKLQPHMLREILEGCAYINAQPRMVINVLSSCRDLASMRDVKINMASRRLHNGNAMELRLMARSQRYKFEGVCHRIFGYDHVHAVGATIHFAHIEIVNCPILTDVQKLSVCRHSLEQLSFQNCMRFGDLSQLKGFDSLWRLDFDYCGVGDLSPLSDLASLEELRIYGCQKLDVPLDVSPLQRCMSLKTLRLEQTLLRDAAEELAKFDTIEVLSLRGSSGLGNIFQLRKCASLKVLDLTNYGNGTLCCMSSIGMFGRGIFSHIQDGHTSEEFIFSREKTST